MPGRTSARCQAIADADGRVSHLQGEVYRRQPRGQASPPPKCRVAAEASSRLALMPPAVLNANLNSAAATQNALRHCRGAVAGMAAKNEADRLQVQISSNEKLLDILAADGLRARKLARVLELFNSQLCGTYAGCRSGVR